MSSGLPDVSRSEHNVKGGVMHARRTKLENRGRDGSPRVASERISLSFTPSGDILRRLKMSFTPSGVPHSTLRWSTRHGVRCCTPYLAAAWMDPVHWTAITHLEPHGAGPALQPHPPASAQPAWQHGWTAITHLERRQSGSQLSQPGTQHVAGIGFGTEPPAQRHQPVGTAHKSAHDGCKRYLD